MKVHKDMIQTIQPAECNQCFYMNSLIYVGHVIGVHRRSGKHAPLDRFCWENLETSWVFTCFYHQNRWVFPVSFSLQPVQSLPIDLRRSADMDVPLLELLSPQLQGELLLGENMFFLVGGHIIISYDILLCL